MAQEPEKLELHLQARPDEALQLGLSLVEQGVEPGACVLLQKKEKQTKMSIFRKGRTSNYPGSYAPPPSSSRTAAHAHARHRTRASLRAHTTAHVCVDLRARTMQGTRGSGTSVATAVGTKGTHLRRHARGHTRRARPAGPHGQVHHIRQGTTPPPHSLTSSSSSFFFLLFVFILSLRT